MKEYACDYRVYKIYIIRGKPKNFRVQLLRSNALFLCWHKDTSSLRLFSEERSVNYQEVISRILFYLENFQMIANGERKFLPLSLFSQLSQDLLCSLKKNRALSINVIDISS